jgi:hypothetical protein
MPATTLTDAVLETWREHNEADAMKTLTTHQNEEIADPAAPTVDNIAEEAAL